MNLILENTDEVEFFTNMKDTFLALGDICTSYDWFVSDIETNGSFNVQDIWISGEKLKAILAENDVQFIWGVFSAFKKGQRIKIEKSPYIDGNSDYWSSSCVRPQLREAQFEIACWDSSATLFIGIDDIMATNLSCRYNDIKSLTFVE